MSTVHWMALRRMPMTTKGTSYLQGNSQKIHSEWWKPRATITIKNQNKQPKNIRSTTNAQQKMPYMISENAKNTR